MQPRISDDYKRMNNHMHDKDDRYGTSGHLYAEQVLEVMTASGSKNILDYGCGKNTLAQSLPQVVVRGYDPCLKGFDSDPKPADMVVCTDVMEHIEPDKVDAVLAHIAYLMVNVAFMVIALVPAKKTLSDGRNAHLIVESMDWWITKLMPLFDIKMLHHLDNRFMVVMEAKHAAS